MDFFLTSNENNIMYLCVSAAFILFVSSHMAVIYLIPKYIMAKTKRTLSAYKPVNVIHPNKPTTSDSKWIVIPCPDFLYSPMSFDISQTILTLDLPETSFNNIALYDCLV